MRNFEELISDLPDPEAARRFFDQLSERHPIPTKKLLKNDALFSDVLALASYSPLLGTTLIQSPEYLAWLDKERSDVSVRAKETLLESLARFALINSSLEPHVLFARFRRRELLRTYLRDIRRLGTVAEITEEISNLADAILENALRTARQEMDNRFGSPMETDENGRKRASDIVVVALGKLGSKELNYSSDIDLLFIYSADGETTGTGSRGSVTNREYFSRLAETVNGLIGRQTGEGAAYRVDMRLRPHGRVGALSLSLKETTKYYLTDARNWERQVLIRSRASAGDPVIFKNFFKAVEGVVFTPGRDPAEALRQVLRSKEKIDDTHRSGPFVNVKLGCGGIREIEFIAQALQLAYGGTDRWLHVGHSLKSISRLADRGYLSEAERSDLSNAYHFLRRLEHIIQMEHGLQTHSLPKDQNDLQILARKMQFSDLPGFQAAITRHTENVHRTFLRVFGSDQLSIGQARPAGHPAGPSRPIKAASARVGSQAAEFADQLTAAVDKFEPTVTISEEKLDLIRKIGSVSPNYAQFVISRPWLVEDLVPPPTGQIDPKQFGTNLDTNGPARTVLNEMRRGWSRSLLRIAIADIFEEISAAESRSLQTELAEASIETALRAASNELLRRFGRGSFQPIIMALGKLGSCTLDHGSDLDMIVSYDGEAHVPNENNAASEYYSRGVEIFVNLLSGMTRAGNLYRVDLRLRPYGRSGPNAITVDSFRDYILNTASVWELLAYVQVRAIGGADDGVQKYERRVRDAIKERVAHEDCEKLLRETREMRLKLEKTHGRPRSGHDINIKFGSGGLLDIYFVVRYLQLISAEELTPAVRSTASKLDAFAELGILSVDQHASLGDGHRFLSELDHNIRLISGRSSRFTPRNRTVLERIAERMKLDSADELSQQVALHRMNIRSAFDDILPG